MAANLIVRNRRINPDAAVVKSKSQSMTGTKSSKWAEPPAKVEAKVHEAVEAAGRWASSTKKKTPYKRRQ